MTTFPRGSSIRLNAQFFDADSLITSPSGANVYLNFRNRSGVLETVILSLTLSGSYWTALWDSRVAEAGLVFGHARTTDPVPISSDDFQFTLESNTANP